MNDQAVVVNGGGQADHVELPRVLLRRRRRRVRCRRSHPNSWTVDSRSLGFAPSVVIALSIYGIPKLVQDDPNPISENTGAPTAAIDARSVRGRIVALAVLAFLLMLAEAPPTTGQHCKPSRTSASPKPPVNRLWRLRRRNDHRPFARTPSPTNLVRSASSATAPPSPPPAWPSSCSHRHTPHPRRLGRLRAGALRHRPADLHRRRNLGVKNQASSSPASSAPATWGSSLPRDHRLALPPHRPDARADPAADLLHHRRDPRHAGRSAEKPHDRRDDRAGDRIGARAITPKSHTTTWSRASDPQHLRDRLRPDNQPPR